MGWLVVPVEELVHQHPDDQKKDFFYSKGLLRFAFESHASVLCIVSLPGLGSLPGTPSHQWQVSPTPS
jgi:hypothetical protein